MTPGEREKAPRHRWCSRGLRVSVRGMSADSCLPRARAGPSATAYAPTLPARRAGPDLTRRLVVDAGGSGASLAHRARRDPGGRLETRLVKGLDYQVRATCPASWAGHGKEGTNELADRGCRQDRLQRLGRASVCRVGACRCRRGARAGPARSAVVAADPLWPGRGLTSAPPGLGSERTFGCG